MKSKSLRVGMEVAIGAPRAVHNKPKRGYIVDPEPWWEKGRYVIGKGQGPPTKQESGRHVAVAVWNPVYERWSPEVVLPAHVLMLWSDYQKKVEAERKKNEECNAVKDKYVAETKAKHEKVAELLSAHGIMYVAAPAYARSYDRVTLHIDDLLKVLTL